LIQPEISKELQIGMIIGGWRGQGNANSVPGASTHATDGLRQIGTTGKILFYRSGKSVV
jgi:hypothetical protein